MTLKEIKDKVNKKCSDQFIHDQGIFFQPYGVPVRYEEDCVYMRVETGGYSGGSCWDDSDPQPYSNSDIVDFIALDELLKIIKPDLSYLQYKEIEGLISTNDETEYEYYGNSTDWLIKYIPVKSIFDYLEIEITC